MYSTLLNPNVFPQQTALVLELFYRNKPVDILPEHTPFLLGRENPEAGLSVGGQFASRLHCSIEFNDGKFVLKDFSRNGTFVVLGRGPSFRIKEESTPLTGFGSIKLGAEFTAEDAESILFKVSHKTL